MRTIREKVERYRSVLVFTNTRTEAEGEHNAAIVLLDLHEYAGASEHARRALDLTIARVEHSGGAATFTAVGQGQTGLQATA